MALRDDVDALIDRETTITGSSAKVARMSYTETAYTNGDSDNAQTRELSMNGVVTYDESAEQNIPIGTPSAIGLNESVVDKGIRSGATIVKQNSFNHFWGRVSYNLNKIHDWFKAFLISFKLSLGTANGVATLDNNGRIPFSQLPESAMEYMGSWNAETNTPHLEDASDSNVNGQFYIVSVAGTQTFDGQSIDFKINDRIICKGTGADSVWQKLSEGNVIDVRENGISLVGDDGVANLIPYFTYVIDSQEKFDAWVGNITTEGQEYSYVAIIGGNGNGLYGEYTILGDWTIPTRTKQIVGFLNPIIKTSAGSIAIGSSNITIENVDFQSNVYLTSANMFKCFNITGTNEINIRNCKINGNFYDVRTTSSTNITYRTILCNMSAGGRLNIKDSNITAIVTSTTTPQNTAEAVVIAGNGEVDIDNCVLSALSTLDSVCIINGSSEVVKITNSKLEFNVMRDSTAYGIKNSNNSRKTYASSITFNSDANPSKQYPTYNGVYLDGIAQISESRTYKDGTRSAHKYSNGILVNFFSRVLYTGSDPIDYVYLEPFKSGTTPIVQFSLAGTSSADHKPYYINTTNSNNTKVSIDKSGSSTTRSIDIVVYGVWK